MVFYDNGKSGNYGGIRNNAFSNLDFSRLAEENIISADLSLIQSAFEEGGIKACLKKINSSNCGNQITETILAKRNNEGFKSELAIQLRRLDTIPQMLVLNKLLTGEKGAEVGAVLADLQNERPFLNPNLDNSGISISSLGTSLVEEKIIPILTGVYDALVPDERMTPQDRKYALSNYSARKKLDDTLKRISEKIKEIC